MKNIITAVFLFLTVLATAQDKKGQPKSQIAEASCGQCQFGMKGNGCELAVRINGKSYFVDGASLESFGDAHAKEKLWVRLQTIGLKLLLLKYFLKNKNVLTD
jgi:hypothetical protein